MPYASRCLREMGGVRAQLHVVEKGRKCGACPYCAVVKLQGQWSGFPARLVGNDYERHLFKYVMMLCSALSFGLSEPPVGLAMSGQSEPVQCTQSPQRVQSSQLLITPFESLDRCETADAEDRSSLM